MQAITYIDLINCFTYKIIKIVEIGQNLGLQKLTFSQSWEQGES